MHLDADGSLPALGAEMNPYTLSECFPRSSFLIGSWPPVSNDNVGCTYSLSQASIAQVVNVVGDYLNVHIQ